MDLMQALGRVILLIDDSCSTKPTNSHKRNGEKKTDIKDIHLDGDSRYRGIIAY